MEHVHTLEKMAPRNEITLLPVPATIEPVGPSPVERMRSEFAVFGLPFGRWQTLEAFDQYLHRWQQKSLLTKLHVIGAADEKFDPRSKAILSAYPSETVVLHGELAASQISQLLHRAQFALTTADDATWSKSSTLMAYAAHGCNVVSLSKSPNEPLCWTVLADEVGALNDSELRRRADGMRQWYESHAEWRIIAAKISELIKTCR